MTHKKSKLAGSMHCWKETPSEKRLGTVSNVIGILMPSQFGSKLSWGVIQHCR